MDSFLTIANRAFRDCQYANAISHYIQFLRDVPALGNSISSNLTLARQRYRQQRASVEKPHIAVCGWELAHEAANRVAILAKIYGSFADVEIIGCLFPAFGREIWTPIRDAHFAKRYFIVEDESSFIEQAIKLVAAHPYDILHLSQPRLPTIIFGILYKLIWNAKILVDIDDEHISFDEIIPITSDDYQKKHGNLPEFNDLLGTNWTRLAVGFIREFDRITVFNSELQQRYGGEIINLAPDENLLKEIITTTDNHPLTLSAEHFAQALGDKLIALLLRANRTDIISHTKAVAGMVEKTQPKIAEVACYLTQTPSEQEVTVSEKDINLLDTSIYFDQNWYINQYYNNQKLDLSPVEYYLKYGWKNGHNPSLLFDGNWYRKYYPDVAEANVPPLLHYVKYGERENREKREVNNSTPLPCNQKSSYLVIESHHDRFETWRSINKLTQSEEDRLIRAIKSIDFPVSLSVIMPVYEPPLNYLDEAIESVLTQIYSNWELCIYVDGDSSPELQNRIRSYLALDSRIKASFGEINRGISVATNEAVKLANGEYVAFLDQDDVLEKTALAEFALSVHGESNVDILYSDDDKLDELGKFTAPQFKPDWSPILLLSYMYMSHLFAVRRQLFKKLGGFRIGYEGSQDYDFALRASEVARKVIHIPKILYHWRVLQGSTAASIDNKPASINAGIKAVQDACDRRGINATSYWADWAAAAKVGMFSLRFPDSGPQITIIIPTKNHIDLLAPCIESIEKLTTYKNYNILIVDNDSSDLDVLSYLAKTRHKVLHLSSPQGKFNFSYLINSAVNACDSDFVLFLNNDTEIRRSDWLSQMVGYAQMSGVGAVGAKLYFPDNTIQHAGIIHGLYGGLAGPVLRNTPSYHHGYLGYAMNAREYSAVTAACLLTPRYLFIEIGGMDQYKFGVAYNDVDYCYRLTNKGYSCIFCPDAELTHFEGKSRGFDDNFLEIAAFRKSYRSFRDRYYNNNLSLENEHFQIKPWRYISDKTKKIPVRVLMVSHNLNHEGAPNSMLEMVRGLKKRGVIDPVVVTPVDGPLRSHYEDVDIEVQVIDHTLHNAHGENIYADNRRKFAEMLRLSGAELIYGNTAQVFWAIDAARDAGLPAIWNIRESEPWQTYFDHLPLHIRKRAYEAFSYPYRVIFVAQSTLDGWKPLNTRHNFTVIHNGLDLEKIRRKTRNLTRATARSMLKLSADDVAVILIGTVCDRKNQKVLINAFSLMTASIASRVRIFIVGDRESTYSTELHQLKANLSEAKQARVKIISETDHPYLYYLAGDIAICSSRLESYPRVVLEAMSLGLPIIATPVFGILEQVQKDVNALLFSPDNAMELEFALTKLISDNLLRKSMGNNSKRLFEGLNQYEDMLSSYGNIMYEASISSPNL